MLYTTLTKSSVFGDDLLLPSGRLSIVSRKGASSSEGRGRDGTN